LSERHGMDGGLMELVAFIAALMLISYVARELEIWRISNEIELYLRLFKASRDSAVAFVAKKIAELFSRARQQMDLSGVEERVNILVDSVIIPVESMDPFGLVRKAKFLLLSVDKTLEEEVRRLVPLAGKSDVDTLVSLLHIARDLNSLYKLVNHNYTLAKRYKSYWLLLQLEALLPFLAEVLRAYEGALDAMMKQIPIGDSVGPLVAHMLARELNATPLELGVEDTEIYLAELDGRRLILVKAEGPGSNVGRLDEAVRRVLATWGGSVTWAVMIDAMVKFEGEASGAIAEGFGVAIGGSGVEKYEVESVFTEHGVRTYAVLIKMSAEEAMTSLSKELYEASVRAKERVKSFVREHVQPGSTVIVVGVGNSIGVR